MQLPNTLIVGATGRQVHVRPSESTTYLPEDTVVLVALGPEHVSDIIGEDRHASWICDLHSGLEGLVESGLIDVKKTWAMEGSVSITVAVRGEVQAESEDKAHEVFGDEVEDDLEAFCDLSSDLTIDSVEVEQAERT